MSKELVSDHDISVSRACKLLSLARSQYYYRSTRDDREVIAALQALADTHPAYGFRKMFACLRRDGHGWNRKKVYRVYRLLLLNKRRRGKRRLPSRVKQPLEQSVAINQSWSLVPIAIGIMSDSLVYGNKFRTLNIIDDCNREALGIEIARSLSSLGVIRTLEGIIAWRGQPSMLRVDNGPEFTSADFEHWCTNRQIRIQYIQPGKPMQNGFIERFNGTYRREVLNAYAFFDLDEVREITERWIPEYNHLRPHEALQNLSPIEYYQQQLNLKNVT